MSTKKEIPFWAKLGHRKPVTRREFLATGIIPFSAWVVAPSIVTLLSRNANAVDCGGDAGTTYIPFITINLEGGPGLAGNVVHKNLAGDYLASYSKVGLGSGPTKSFNIVKEFGNADFPGTAITGSGAGTTRIISQFLDGVRSPTPGGTRSTALDKTAFIAQAARAGDDTSSNPLDISGLVMKMGMAGQSLPNLGTSNTNTGINQKAAAVPPPSPFIVNNVNALTNALGYTDALSGLNSGQKVAMARAIANLSGEQVKLLGTSPGLDSTKKIVECSGGKNSDLIQSGGGSVNPFSNATATAPNGLILRNELARIWLLPIVTPTTANGNSNVDPTKQDSIFAALAFNSIVGNAATVGMSLGGFDYHDGTRTTGDAKDRSVGALAGKILQTAELMGKPVFIYVCTDGATTSTVADTPDTAWQSDRGLAATQYIMAYDPAGRPATSSNLIGGFNADQAGDDTFIIGNNTELAAQSIFANYAALNGKLDYLDKYRIMGDKATRDLVIKFTKT